jgi:cell division protein FtsL
MFKLVPLVGLILMFQIVFAQEETIQQSSSDELEREKLALERERLTLEEKKLAFEKEKFALEKQNFGKGQRIGTWALNALTINGLGSWLIMGDVLGGFVHLGFGVGTIAFLVAYLESRDDQYCYSFNNCYYRNYNENYLYTAYIFYLTGAAWNIYRSASYDRPNKQALLDIRNFHLAAVPRRNGTSLSPGLFYSVKF